MADTNDPRFLGKHEVITAHVAIANPDKLVPNFAIYDRNGMTLYKRIGDWMFAVRDRDALQPGDVVYFLHPLAGGYWVCTVNRDRTSAESDEVIVSLEYDSGIADVYPGEWIGSCFACTKSLSRVDYVV